jgi:hypothetical protein
LDADRAPQLKAAVGLLALMNLMKQLLTLLLPLTLLLICCLVPSACVIEPHSMPATYLFPEGYIGWVRVDFNVEGTPELPIENGRQIYQFPPSGYLRTSSKLEYSRGRDVKYFYYSGDSRHPLRETAHGRGGMIWFGGSNALEENPKESYQYIFVGLEDVYERHHDRPFHLNENGVFVKNGDLKVGQIKE